jgi:hypothetical protein
MSYADLLHDMGAATLPVFACVALIALGAVCDMWTNAIASNGKRVWHRFRCNSKDISSN